MSETTPGGGRSRRRASRHAGPPVEDQQTVRQPTSGAAAAETSDPAEATTVRVATSSSDWSTADVGDETTRRSTTTTYVDDDTSLRAAADSESGADAAGSTDTTDTDTDETDDTGSNSARLGKLGWFAAVVAVIAFVGLLGSGGFFFYHQNHADNLADQRAEYVQTAKQAVLNLTHISADTAPQDIDRVLAVSSGELKNEYAQRKDAYAQVVQQAKVNANGEVIESAIESQDDSSAKVMVAAKQTLTNAGTQQPQERYYRFRVTVVHDDKGTTASSVEFVA